VKSREELEIVPLTIIPATSENGHPSAFRLSRRNPVDRASCECGGAKLHRSRSPIPIFQHRDEFAEIDSRVLFSGVHRRVFGYHRLLAKRFPYAVYYRVEENRVAIVPRVLDLRQAPSKIRRALE